MRNPVTAETVSARPQKPATVFGPVSEITYCRGIKALHNVWRMIRVHQFFYIKRFYIREIHFILKSIIEEIRNKPENLLNIDALSVKGDFFTHSLNVCIISTIIGLMFDFDEKTLNRLALGSYFHDIGKVYIKQSILYKPSSLTREEFAEVQNHSLYGYEILNKIGLNSRAALVALRHHERVDGSGYPHGLTGESIDLLSGITAVADSFEAMTSCRIYRKNVFGKEEALRELERMPLKYKPSVIEILRRTIRI